MRLWVDKFTEEMKEYLTAKRELISRREALKKSIKSGDAYFSARINNPNARELQAGANRMIEIIADLDKLDKAIVDLDIVMITKLEAYLGNFTARVKMPDRLNDAGDLIRHDEIYAVPFNSGDENLKEITPDDIWFLKMIKEAYKATNITFEEKSE